MKPRTLLKRAAERVLRLAGGSPARMAGRSLVLAWHNVVPDEDVGLGDRSLHLAFSRFRRQLDLLERHTTVISLTDLLGGGAAGARPRVALTFDDAYAGAVSLALPELARRGLPVTLFIAPGILGAKRFWWDALAGPEGLGAEDRERILAEGGRPTPDCWPAGVLPPSYGGATETEVRALARLSGITLGAHSWSHPNLARLPEDEYPRELADPLTWLRAQPTPAIPVLAYPYGLTTPAVQSAAQAAGYQAALRVDGGWLPAEPDAPMALPRYNVPAGLSDDGFLLRLSGRLLR